MPADAGVEHVGAGGFDRAGMDRDLISGEPALHQIERGDSIDDHERRARRRTDPPHDLDRQAQPILERAAPAIGPRIGAHRDELGDEIAFRGHDLDAIVTGVLRQLGRARVVGDGLFDLGVGQRMDGAPVDRRGDIGRADQLRHLRVAAGMQDLQRDQAAASLDGIDHGAVIGKLGFVLEHRGVLFHPPGPVRCVAAGDHQGNPALRPLAIEGRFAREHGLMIENEAQGNLHVATLQVTDDPATIDVVDLVIIAVKLWDTAAAAEAVCPLVGPHTAVLSLQNGVIKDDILRRAFGAPAIVAGVAYVATHIARPGVTHQVDTMQRIAIGEYDEQPSQKTSALVDALVRAGVSAEVSADIRRTLWEKYVFLVGLSAITTTMRTTIGPIRQNQRTRAFLHDLFKETVAVGRAHGVRLPADYADERLAFADGVPPTMRSSMHHDLERGNPLEVEWLSGGVVSLARIFHQHP